MSPTLQDARLLWDFLGQGRCHVPCELLVVCGSYDLRVCDHACELLERGLAERLLFTGNTGHWTRHLWVEPEAELFARHARARGVSDSLIVIEPRATNFAENIAFARELFPDLRRATFVTKPNSIRRVARPCRSAGRVWRDTWMRPTTHFPTASRTWSAYSG